MNRSLTLAGLLITTGLLTAFAVHRPSPDEAAIRQAVQYYIDGQAAGDRTIVARAFHPDARMTGLRDGGLRTVAIQEYLTWFRGEPAADEADRTRWIESVDVAGDAAVVKVVLDYPRVRFTDYMSLLKLDGEWKIVHKNYDRRAKEP